MESPRQLTKAHVKHSVGLIKHQICHSLQIRGLPPHQVYQPTLWEGAWLTMTS